MSNNYKNILWAKNARSARFGGKPMIFFGLWLFMFFSTLGMVGQNGVTITSTSSSPTFDNPIPINFQFNDGVDDLLLSDINIVNGTLNNLTRLVSNYKFLFEKNINKFSVKANAFDFLLSGMSFSEYFRTKIKNAIVSIDFNNRGEMLFLTFGNGVFKYDISGNHVQLINGSQFTSPFDMAISSTNQILIADKESYRVRVYNEKLNLTYIFSYDIGGSKGKDGDEFYGPTGLAINKADELFVADSYTGSELNILDQVKIYKINNANATFYRRYDSSGNIKIDDPYRIAVDKNNFVYLSDSGGDSELGRVLVFNNNDNLQGVIEGGEQGAPGSLIVDNYGYIYIINYKEDLTFNGIFQDPLELINNFEKIKNSNYEVNIFDAQLNYVTKINENINLPIDLALDKCGHIFVNNLKLSGKAAITGIDASFDFKLEEFKRQDTFTAEVEPIAAGLVTVTLKKGSLFKCDPQPVATFSIEYKPEDNTAPEAKCKPVTLSLDASGNATLTAAQIYDGDATADNVTLKIDKSNFDCSNLGSNSVTLTVTGENNKTNTCIAIVTVIDEIPPTANCVNPFTIELDANGTASITEANIDNNSTDNCGIENYSLSQSNFTRTDIGLNTIILTITDTSGRKDTCTVQVTVEDNNTVPEAKCKSATLSLDANGNATLTAAQIYDGDATADNVTLKIDKSNFDCSNLGSNSVTLTVTGENNKTNTCIAIVTVIDEIPPTANCVNPFTIELDANGTASITEANIDNNSTDNCGIENYSLSQSNFTRTDIGLNTIILTITDTSGRKDTCTVQVTVEDNNTVPEAKCKSATLSLDANGNATLTAAQIYDGDATADNVTLKIDKSNFDCSNLGSNSVTLTVTGENNKTNTCTAIVTVIDKIPPTVNCPSEILVEYTTDKTYTVPDFSTLYSSSDNCSSTLKYFQSPEIGAVITEDKFANFKVGDESNNFTTCNFNIKFFKKSELQILNCPPTQTFEVDENCSYVIPDISSTINTNIEGAEVTQNISPGFRVNGSLTLTITAKYENQTDTCEVLLLAKDSIQPVIDCPSNQNEAYNPENGFSLPNYSLEAQASDNCAVAKTEQIPNVGTIIFEDTEVTIRVEDVAGNFETCKFMVLLTEDTAANTPPVAIDDNYNTNRNITLSIPASGVLGNDTDADTDALTAILQTTTTNGSLTLNQDGSFVYIPNTNFTGRDIFTYVANDGGENSNVATVTIIVNVDPPPNSPPVANGENYSTNQNITLSIPASGVLGNDTDADTDALTAILQTTTTNGSLTLNPNGSFVYIPNNNFTGEDSFTYVVNDGTANSNVATARIEVIPVSDNTVTCKETVVLELDANGNATLNAEDLFTTRPADLQFSVSKVAFTCSDLGENVVTLSYNNSEIQGSCEIKVSVMDATAPVINVIPLSIALNEFGSISITPEMLDNGTTDNCDEITYSLSKKTFGCKDIGDNMVIFTATDNSGNSSTANVLVTITGNCEILPIPGVEYIFIYPNPTSGPFQFSTPTGVTIDRVEAFDFRGRMIMFKEFSAGELQYAMDLSGVQNAVYILKLYTSEGISIIRVIIN